MAKEEKTQAIQFLIDDEEEAIEGYKEKQKLFAEDKEINAELEQLEQDEVRHKEILQNILNNLKQPRFTKFGKEN